MKILLQIYLKTLKMFSLIIVRKSHYIKKCMRKSKGYTIYLILKNGISNMRKNYEVIIK